MIDPTVPAITRKSDGQPTTRAPSLTALDIARLNAAYACPDNTAEECYDHVVLDEDSDETVISSAVNPYKGCTVVVSAVGRRVQVETVKFKVR